MHKKWRQVLYVSALVLATLGGNGCTSPHSTGFKVAGLELRCVDGQQITLGDDHVWVINFWATSCATCVDEMPALNAFANSNPAIGVVGVAMPYDLPNRVLAMRQALKLTFPIALDPAGDAIRAFGDVAETPTTFVVDGDGVVQYRVTGRIEFDVLKRESVRQLPAG